LLINKIRSKRKKKEEYSNFIIKPGIVEYPSFLKKSAGPNTLETVNLINLSNEKKINALEDTKNGLEVFPYAQTENNCLRDPIYDSNRLKQLDPKKINKSLNKIVKDLKWPNRNLKVIIKRFEKKKINVNLPSLQKGSDLINQSINELETGLRKFNERVKLRKVKDKKRFVIKEKRFEPLSNDYNKDLFDIKLYSIKMNISKGTLIKSLKIICFYKKKVLILLKNENLNFLKPTLIKFYDNIFAQSFDKNILVLTEKEYNKQSNSYNDYIVLLGENIIGKHSNEIYVNDSKFEEKLISDFYDEPKLEKGLDSLRNKIQEIYDLSHEIYEFYIEKNEKLSRKNMIRHLEDTHPFLNYKIKKDYFAYLLNIVRHYFAKEIIFSEDLVGNKIETLWERK